MLSVEVFPLIVKRAEPLIAGAAAKLLAVVVLKKITF